MFRYSSPDGATDLFVSEAYHRHSTTATQRCLAMTHVGGRGRRDVTSGDSGHREQ